uniref:Uncharacterized protein n=1 Tax=viral metagenome TaxID=1070528 RepID=A0A6C0B356_9ZZZZ
MDENEDLDISWIEEQEKLQTVDKNYFRESMDTITVTIIYININLYIENIISEKHVLSANGLLEKERLLQIIQSKKKTTAHSRYKFMDALLYNVDLESGHIQKYANTPTVPNEPNPFFKRLSIIDDIVFSPSIFIFHGLNGLYLLFKEEPRTDIQNIKTKSILKSDGDQLRKITKKVKLVLKKQNQSTTKKRIKNEDTDNNT